MRPLRRATTALASAAASALALTLTTIAPASAAGHDPVPAQQGAHWLEHQLGSRHLFHNPNFGGFDDYGLSADAAIELATLGHHRAAREIAHAIAPHAANAWVRSTYGGVTTTYGGSVAKALVLAEEAGLDVHRYGGMDLPAVLSSLVIADGPAAGRVQDRNDAYGDANVLGQALAARGLTAAHAPEAASVVSFLLEQQCSAGYFRLTFTSDKTSSAQSCDAAGGTADGDATSYAVIQLRAIAHKSAPVRTAIADAQAWLRHHQQASGGWSGTGPTSGANSNSTGLAAWALGNSPAARKAAVWLRKHQARDAAGCHTRLSKHRGAVAYDGAAMTTGLANGITTATSDQWRRATTQAAVGLTLLPRASHPIRVTTRSTTVHAHHTIRAHVQHAAPYSKVCVRIGTHHVARSVGAHGRATVKLKVPAGRHHRNLVVVDSDGRADHVRLTVR